MFGLDASRTRGLARFRTRRIGLAAGVDRICDNLGWTGGQLILAVNQPKYGVSMRGIADKGWTR
jgi:hypothetical protein